MSFVSANHGQYDELVLYFMWLVACWCNAPSLLKHTRSARRVLGHALFHIQSSADVNTTKMFTCISAQTAHEGVTSMT